MSAHRPRPSRPTERLHVRIEREHGLHAAAGQLRELRRERTARLHAHFSHIEYNDKGEVRHLTFADTVYGPDFAPVAEETAARGYTPTFICESAGTQAEDALSMKRCYQTCKGE